MNRKNLKYSSFYLTRLIIPLMLIFIFNLASFSHNINNVTPEYIINAREKIIDYYFDYAFDVSKAGNPENDMLVYSLALSDNGDNEDKQKNNAYSQYLATLEEYVRECYDKNGGFDLATDYCRLSLVINALGGNPLDIAFENNAGINLLDDGVFNNTNLGRQGANAYIWALMAINACDAVPAENMVNSVEKIIYSLLLSELQDGGFALSGDMANADITAQAIRALAPFRDLNPDAEKASERCFELLLSMKNSDGTYTSFGTPNLECTAQTVLACDAMNRLDLLSDLENAYNPVTACIKFFYEKNNTAGFLHTESDDEINVISTAQGLEAITAFLNNMPNIENANEENEENFAENIYASFGAYINIVFIMLLIFGLLLVMDVIHKRRNNKNV